MSIELLKQEIELREEQRLKSKQSLYQRRNCIASDLGECLKERYHSITDWDKKPLAPLSLQARFEKGNEEESKVIRVLMENGFEIVEGQKPFQIKDRNGRVIITGKIDGKIRYNGTYYPFEVKSLTPNIYERINVVEDFNGYGFFSKYPKQLNCYLFGENLSDGMFILTDCMGHYKVIIVNLDFEAMEKELANCTIVMTHVDKQIPPSFTKNYSLCRKCWAAKTCCFPPLDFGEGVQVLDEPELENDLKRREELSELRAEYESLDKSVKDRFKASPGLHALVGNYEVLVESKKVKYKAQPARTLDQVKVKIERIKDNGNGQV